MRPGSQRPSEEEIEKQQRVDDVKEALKQIEDEKKSSGW